EKRIDRDQPAVWGEFHQAPAALLRAIKLAAWAKGEPVHPVEVAPHLVNGAGLRIETQQAAFVDGAEQHRSAVPDDAAGRSFKGAGNRFESPRHGSSG